MEARAADKRRRKLREINGNRQAAKVKVVEATKNTNISKEKKQLETNASVSVSLEPQIPDPIEEKIRRERDKETNPTLSGVIRGVDSLGAWAGASLLVSLRIKGVVDIERDSFLQHGLAGARRDGEANIASGTQKGMSRPSLGGQRGWTLGPWA